MSDALGYEPAQERREDAPSLPRPRTRWAAVVWGVALGATAALGLWILLDPSRRSGIADWTLGLTPLSASAYLVLAIGLLVLVTGVGGLARRAQRRLARDTEDSR
ncbi:hypothetical protein ACTU3I_13380 [Microbacterium sp. RD1]|uniref:hypothetical protein n=1 Tax=Microbacterium sp. RD1 TaxID=3457313 RepID=UPI003FA60CA8